MAEGSGLPLDVLAEALGMDENGLVAFLEGIEGGKLKKPAPLLEVNTDTLNALVDRLGAEGARSYLKDRARYLTKQQKAIQQEYDRDKNNAQVKADLEAAYREQRKIADGLRALEGTLKAEADIAPEVSIEPVSLTPESGRSIDEAEDSELLLTADGSTELGRIDEDVAKAAGIAAGEIRANVGAVRHAEEGHGGEILGSGYPDVETFFFDVLSAYERVYRGSNDSLLLTKPLGGHHAVAAIELVNEDGVYRAKTGWTIRERKLNKKELLFARSEPLAADPGAGVVSRTGPNEDREGTAPTAKQKSNSAATVPPGKANVNPMLTLSEAMRRGYAMAEKYARAAFKAGREFEAERLAGFKDRAAEKLDRLKEKAAAKLEAQTQEEESQAQGQTQVQGQAVDGLGENGAEEDTNVYLPAQAIESYNQENPGLLEDLGIVVEPVEGTSEVRLTAEQYEALEDVAPELAEAVKNDVRRGSKGMTTREVGETLKKKAERPAWRTAEVDGITKELEQEALGAGLDKAEARQWSKMAGSFIGVTSKRYNIAPSELAKMKLRQGTEETQGESFGQPPLNNDVDLGARVNVVKAQRTMSDVPFHERDKAFTPEMRAEIVERFQNGQVVNAHTGLTVTLSKKGGLKHILSTARNTHGESGDALYQAIPYLDQIVREAYRVESHDDRKPPAGRVEGAIGNLKQVHRFLAPVDFGGENDRHIMLLVTKEYETGKTEIEDISLYDMQHAKKLSGRPSQNGSVGTEQSWNTGAPDNISVRELVDAVNDVEGRPYLYAPEGEKYDQSAYNGSPVLYDKFDMSKVGSGNGTASYGWGAYLSSAREVAELYVRLAGGFGENVQVAKFDIPENDVLLSYDKRFSEQPQKVKDALQPYADEYKQSDGERGIKIYDVFSGAQIQEKIADALNEGRISVEGGLNGPVEANSREVSMFLNSLGIPGLRYLDDGGKGDNFVIWDENVIHMLEWEVNGRVETFAPAPQTSARQSEEYDPGDPKTWQEGPARDEALALQAWQNLETNEGIETWPESPEKTEALALEKEYDKIATWIENLSPEEFTRRLQSDDPEFTQKNERGVDIEERLNALRKGLLKRSPKEIEKRLLQLIEAEEEAAAREAEAAARDAEEYYQIIGKRRAKALDKAKEGTVRLDNLNVAREMEQSGKDAKTIRLATGWERGADGKWRYEIPDGTFRHEGFISNSDLLEFRELERKFIDGDITEGEQARLKELTPIVRETRKPSRLSDFYDAPELYAAYPELADISVKFQDRYGEGKGSYSPSENTISLDMDLRGDAAKTVLVHEIQHAIQRIEGFARGGSPSEMWLGQARKHTLKIYKELRAPLSLEEYAKNAWQTDEVTDEIRRGYKEYLKTATSREADRAAQEGAGRKAYHHLGGEVEARNAEKRTRLSNEERKERLLTETEDVAREDQIILEEMMDSEMAYSVRRGPLTFKLTGKSVSAEYMAALEKLEAGEPVAAEEYSAIPEIQDARGRTATGSTLGMPGREAIRKQVYDKLMSYGSAVTEVVDGQKRTVYNGEVRNDRRADIIIGLPASGKSSALVDPISSKYKSMLIDSDEAKKLIPEFDDGFGAGFVHEESKAVVSRVYEDATDEGRNVVIPIVGSNYTKLEKDYINLLRQKGYKVYVHMADINPNVAAGRNLRRFAETGRFVDLEATSFKYGNKPREVFERVKKKGIADGYSRIDTTVFPGRQVEGTEDISHDRGDLRERRGGVPQGAHEVQGRESSQAGAAGGAAAGLGAERAGGTSREGTAPRGVSAHPSDINARLTVQPDGVSLIEFFKNANRSSSFHELAHHMFRVIYELSGRDGVAPQLIEDVNTILREAGVTREEFDADTNGARTRVHEFFARGFEVYISEGKAPSKELRGVFRRLRAWMIEVYHDVVQALGIELSDEMRGVYDRLLAMPEEIDAETTIRELAVEEAALKEEIQRHEQEARERANAVKAAYREGVKVGREAEAEKLTEFKEKAAERLAESKDRAAEKLGRVKEEAAGKLDELEVKRRLQLGSERAKAQMRIAALKQKLQERQKLKKEVNKLVKGINKMAKSESIAWTRHKELEKLLADYDLKKRRQETLDIRAELEEYLKENPEAADTMNAADLKYLGTRTLNDMTLGDLRTLNEQIQQIYDRGKEEYKVWDLERTERRDTIHSELVAVLKKRKTNLPKIVTKAEDIKKQYKGITGKLAKAKDWAYAATLGPDRFFDWLDKGATDYTGAFVRYLVDEVNKQRDVALRHIFERRKWMEDRLKPLGFRMSDFTRIAATVEGKDFTWDDIMEIYIGMRNDKKGRAILYGNLKNVSDPEGTAAYLIGLLTENHKKAAELVVEDHNRNVDRIEAGLIDAFQKGMDRETDYTSIHRLEHLSSMGLIDAESAEALTDGMADAGVLRRVEDGFMKKRVEIKDENQTPIKLGLFNNWHEDVSRHEHSAAMASTARDLAGALLMRNPVDGQTIGRMVKERFGDEAWRALVDFVNTNVTDDARLAHTLLDGMSNTMMKNMAIAYLAGNLGTVLKQTTSIPRFLITAGPHRMLVSIAQFLTQGPKFLEKVYELDPLTGWCRCS